MVFLIIALCLVSNPTVCTEVSPYEAVPFVQCSVNGEAGAIEFLADHPKWMLLGWKCRAETEKTDDL